jgi:exonuclease I
LYKTQKEKCAFADAALSFLYFYFFVRSFQHFKTQSEQREESSKKRVKATPKESSAMAQSALYAAERMSNAIWISHTINLVIIGKLP